MNADELAKFLAERKPSPQLGRFDADQLHCYGCAHSNSSAKFPGQPSGERPCCSCIRNKDRVEWLNEVERPPSEIVVDDQGNARIFDAFQGAMYNGAPNVYFPMDNYVTLDQRDQGEWLGKHPDYGKAISFKDGVPTIVEG